MGLATAKSKVRDLWARQEIESFEHQFTANINPHGAGLFRVVPE
jgi:hypothetical protein